MVQKLLLSLALALALPVEAGASELGAAFEIVRKGDPIGVHIVDVTPREDGFDVSTRIAMRVKFGPVTLFRYAHHAVEHWRNGRLERLTSTTEEGGTRQDLTVERVGETFLVDGSAFKGVAPADAIPSSYWNKSILETDRLLNTQTGEIIDVSVADLGVTTAPGGAPAQHHRLTGSVSLDLWYDDLRWVGADFTVRGERLSYRPIDGEAQRRLATKMEVGPS